MFWFKCCPKCNDGDLYEGKDIYGGYIACLQCGYYPTEAEAVALKYASRSDVMAGAGGAVQKRGTEAAGVR